jgi:RsiW-degrading membrane proteinase PrsW (M82 family)
MVQTFIRYGVSVLPVIVLLVSLIFLDSYKLIRFRSVGAAVLAGVCAAAASFAIGHVVLARSGIAFESYARHVAPPLEEAMKLCYIVWLIRRKRIGFMVDAAIYGFALGTGFAIFENVYYLRALATTNVLLWIIRGFGTAVMHGGTTALAGIIALAFVERDRAHGVVSLLPGFIAATLIHSLYNYGLLDPVRSALCVTIALPLIMILVFQQSERGLKEWLGIGFDSDSQLLEMITTGTIAETRVGRYLLSLKARFPGEAVADMLCLVRLHVELALKAKGVLLMREAGFDVKPDPEVREKFDEMRYLEKSIGKTGLRAIEPVLHWSSRDLWQLYMLGKN